MKVLVHVKDEKAAFILELLRSFKFVKVEELSPNRAEILENLQEAIEELKHVKTEQKRAQTLSDFLDEL